MSPEPRSCAQVLRKILLDRPTPPSPKTPPPTPSPVLFIEVPQKGAEGEGRGSEAELDQIVETLRRARYRERHNQRDRVRREMASRLIASGLSASDLERLWGLAREQADRPSHLFAWWLDNGLARDRVGHELRRLP